jgi:hypothetical protein
MKARALYAILTLLVVAACASVKPAAINAGDRCLRCKQTISDLRVAGEIIDRLRAPFPFRTAGCMAKYVKATPPDQITAVFVTDFNSGRMVAADDAWFVPAQLLGPDGRRRVPDYIAFRSRADAEAAREGQPLLRWNQVVAEATH